MAEKITGDVVKKIAFMSKIALSAAEAESFAGQLGEIMKYMDKLDGLDTAGVEPTSHLARAGKDPVRPDEPAPSLEVDESLRNAPESHGGYFKVPGILEDSP